MKRNLIFLLVLTLLLSIGFMGNVNAEEIESNRIAIATAFESQHVATRAAYEFADLMEERSEGKIVVDVLPSGVIGGEGDIAEAVSTEAVEMQTGGTVPIQMYASEHMYFAIPFVYEDWDHLSNVWESELRDQMNESLIEDGDQKIIGWFYRGYRQFTSNKPIREPEDVVDINLRLPMFDHWLRPWREALNVSPTAVPLNELYTALATGVAEASEGDTEQLWAFSLHEVQDYLSLTRHQVQEGFISINNDFFERQNEATQDLIIETVRDVSEWATDLAMEREQDLINELEAEGMEVIETNYEAFYEKAEPFMRKMFEEEFHVSYEEIMDFAD